MRVLVTGSSGLIGSEAVDYFDRRKATVFGVDNNMRADFFGPGGDTDWNLRRLQATCSRFEHHALDIRDRMAMDRVVADTAPDLIIHCAAQPSHDLAKSRPFDDFDVNATGTLNLLEATRSTPPTSVFILMSTNKVYGDAPNELPMVELQPATTTLAPRTIDGIDETCRVDRCTHSLFGVSKLAGDVMTQEYGRYFGMKTGVFRGGCLTGPHHSGVQLHGFLSYLAKVAGAGRNVHDHRLQGQASPRPDPQRGRDPGVRGILPRPEAWRGLQPRWRPRQRGVDSGIARPIRPAHRPADSDPLRGDHPGRRPHLLHHGPGQVPRHYPGWELTHSLDDIVDEMYRTLASQETSVGG